MDTQSTVVLPCTIVNISGRPYRALIDSGAEISLMHYDVAKEMNIHYSTEVEPAYGADQKPIAVEGVAQSRIAMHKLCLNQEFTIIKNCSFDIVLGYDALVAWNLSIKPAFGVYSIGPIPDKYFRLLGKVRAKRTVAIMTLGGVERSIPTYENVEEILGSQTSEEIIPPNTGADRDDQSVDELLTFDSSRFLNCDQEGAITNNPCYCQKCMNQGATGFANERPLRARNHPPENPTNSQNGARPETKAKLAAHIKNRDPRNKDVTNKTADNPIPTANPDPRKSAHTENRQNNPSTGYILINELAHDEENRSALIRRHEVALHGNEWPCQECANGLWKDICIRPHPTTRFQFHCSNQQCADQFHSFAFYTNGTKPTPEYECRKCGPIIHQMAAIREHNPRMTQQPEFEPHRDLICPACSLEVQFEKFKTVIYENWIPLCIFVCETTPHQKLKPVKLVWNCQHCAQLMREQEQRLKYTATIVMHCPRCTPEFHQLGRDVVISQEYQQFVKNHWGLHEAPGVCKKCVTVQQYFPDGIYYANAENSAIMNQGTHSYREHHCYSPFWRTINYWNEIGAALTDQQMTAIRIHLREDNMVKMQAIVDFEVLTRWSAELI